MLVSAIGESRCGFVPSAKPLRYRMNAIRLVSSSGKKETRSSILIASSIKIVSSSRQLIKLYMPVQKKGRKKTFVDGHVVLLSYIQSQE